MGREIVYCCECQRRILGDELDRGTAYQVGNHFTCSTCAVHLLEKLPSREKEKLLAKMFQETKDRQTGPTHGSRGASPTPRKGTATSPIKIVKVPIAAPGSRSGPRWGLFAGLGLGVVATIVAFVALGGSSTRVEEPSPTPRPSAPSAEDRRRQAAADAIRKARDFAQANGSDIDRTATLWQEAVFAADGTTYLADAKRELEAARVRQREVVKKESADLDQRIRTLMDQEEFKAARDAVEAVRTRHAVPEWTVETTRMAGSISDQVAKTLTGIKEKAAAAKREGDENTAAQLRARVARWGLDPSLSEFDRILAGVSLPRPIEDPALVGYWHLDEGNGTTARDSSGKGQTARLSGTSWGAGRFGSGLYFDGSQSFAEIPGSPELDHLQEHDYTLTAWVKPEAVPTSGVESYSIIVKQGFHGGLFFNLHSRFYMGQWLREKSDIYVQVDSGHTYKPGDFHHVVGVVDWTRGTTRIYVDAILEGNTKWSRPKIPCPGYGNNPWRIGLALPGANEYRCAAKAVINEVRLYSRALAESEVQVLFKSRPAVK